MNKEFDKFNISQEIIEALNILGYAKPTEIQERVIPPALLEKDIVGKSQTGSGKTAAFAIPLCEKVIWHENKPQAIIIEPTRELTVQVKQEVYHVGRLKRLKVADVFGGFPIDKQIQTLKQKCHIVVGTPGRMMDHVRRGSLDLSMVKFVIIDEADLLLDMGFIDEVRQILSHIKGECTRMLFSATLGKELEHFVWEYLKEPLFISIEENEEDKAHIRQALYEVENEDKYQLFLQLLIQENPDSCMIFCGTREMVNVLCRKLRKDGVKCGMIHGDIDQQDRIRTIEGFREGQFRYLIATDVVARGIDFEQLSHVFNYDFPLGKETYIHRIGRTGRNGNSGAAISLLTNNDKKMKQMIEDYTGSRLPIAKWNPISAEDEMCFWIRQKEKVVLKKKKGSDFQCTITKLSIGGGKKSKIRAVDIVGTICNIPGIESEDIGVIDIRESLSYVEILNSKGKMVHAALQDKKLKGKIRKVRFTKL